VGGAQGTGRKSVQGANSKPRGELEEFGGVKKRFSTPKKPAVAVRESGRCFFGKGSTSGTVLGKRETHRGNVLKRNLEGQRMTQAEKGTQSLLEQGVNKAKKTKTGKKGKTF